MGSDLAAFQDAFARALLVPHADIGSMASIDRLAAQPGFAVYRNTVLKGCVDALQANYPTVARLVGDEWFRAAAAEFVRDALPPHPTLLDYGADFAEFLSSFAPAAELPYLVDVARLDRLWSEAHVAADAPVLDPARVAALDPRDMAQVRIRLHAAARWRWFERSPIYSIWSRNRAGNGEIGELDWQGEGALLTRPLGEVLHCPLHQAGAVFLDACARRQSIEDAVTAALDVDEHADFSALISQLLQAGVFSGLESDDHKESPR
jgi:Putative DNA-binding domain